MGHAHTALRIVNQGNFRNEIIYKVYDVSIYSKKKFEGFFKDRVIIITNKSIMFIVNSRKLITRVDLHMIKGMMFYFQNKKYNSIVVETNENKICSMQTDLPEINQKILSDLKQQLEKLGTLNEQKKTPAV